MVKGAKALEMWCARAASGYPGVEVVNMSSAWRDGLAFAAIVHCHRPHLFDFEAVRRRPPAERLDLAFGAIEKHLGITRLLDPEDLVKPDKKSVMTYLMCMYEVLPHEDDFVPAAAAPKKSVGQSPSSKNNLIGSPLKTPIKDMTNGRERFIAPMQPPPFISDAVRLSAIRGVRNNAVRRTDAG